MPNITERNKLRRGGRSKLGARAARGRPARSNSAAWRGRHVANAARRRWEHEQGQAVSLVTHFGCLQSLVDYCHLAPSSRSSLRFGRLNFPR